MGSPENMWVKFFTEAGLPSGISATYALKFTDNRIQMNMLLDLNKEYLREMGITCMGDVIAILRHAKKVHEETARDRVLGGAEQKVPVAAIVARSGTQKAPTPATRMLEHYTRNSATNSPSPQSTVSSNVATLKDRLGAMQLSGLKRKVITMKDTSPASDSNEKDDMVGGKYNKKTLEHKNISGPLSEIQVPQEKKISTVFSRLGLSDDTRVTSTTTTPAKQNIKVTSKTSSSTVFSRLGGKDGSEGTRRDSSDGSEPLKYAGILVKDKVVLKRKIAAPVKNIKKMGTMRADEEPVSIKDKLPASHQHRKTVKFSPHVDYKEIEKRPTPEVQVNAVRSVRTVALTSRLPNTIVKNVQLNKSTPNKIVKKTPLPSKVSSIKSRLGKTMHPNKTNGNVNKSSVFNRLGTPMRA